VAQALKKQDPDGVVAEKHGLRKKLHAWWHGYELAPVIDFDAETGVRSRDQKSKAAEADGSWTPARLMLAQQVWGSGALNPLDEDYLYTMIDDWPLTASDRVLEIADSLGRAGASSMAASVLKSISACPARNWLKSPQASSGKRAHPAKSMFVMVFSVFFALNPKAITPF